MVGRAGVSTLSAVVCAFLKVNTGTIAAGFVFCASYHTGRSDTFEAGTTGVVAFSAMSAGSLWINATDTTA